MTGNSLQCIKQISTYLQVPINKLTLDEEKLPTCIHENKTITGFINIIEALAISKPSIMGSSIFERALVRQWLHYSMTYGMHCNQQILTELNKTLALKTYFVGCNLTMADVAMFYVLQHNVQKMNHLDKEKYLNLSRWFDNIQQNNDIRKDKAFIDFSTIFLSCTVR